MDREKREPRFHGLSEAGREVGAAWRCCQRPWYVVESTRRFRRRWAPAGGNGAALVVLGLLQPRHADRRARFLAGRARWRATRQRYLPSVLVCEATVGLEVEHVEYPLHFDRGAKVTPIGV